MKSFNAKKEYKAIQEWLVKPSNKLGLFDGPQRRMIDLLEDEISMNSVARSASQLGHSSIWWNNLFLSDVWQNNETAKDHGALMLDYKYWEIRILTEKYDLLSKEDPSYKSVVNYFRCYPPFALLLTFNRWQEALWLGKRIYGSNEDKCFGSWKMDRVYVGFVLRLYLIMVGQSESGESISGLPDCGVYQGLFTHWNDEDALQQSIVEVCDEHYLRSMDSMEKKLGIVEFSSRPYNVLPVEILAFRAVRRKMGLTTPLPSHPMLDTSFVANLPKELPSVRDKMLAKVIAGASEIMPSVLDVHTK